MLNLEKNKPVKIIFFIALLLINKNSYSKEVKYKITESAGMIGCISKEGFQRAIDLSLSKNIAAMQALISSGECLYLIKDSVLYGEPNLCSKKDKATDIFQFRLDGLTKKIFLPCAAINYDISKL